MINDRVSGFGESAEIASRRIGFRFVICHPSFAIPPRVIPRMFDNRWENWAGDFAESYAATSLDPAVRACIPEILAEFGAGVRAIDIDFPDEVSPGTFATVLTETMPRL